MGSNQTPFQFTGMVIQTFEKDTVARIFPYQLHPNIQNKVNRKTMSENRPFSKAITT